MWLLALSAFLRFGGGENEKEKVLKFDRRKWQGWNFFKNDYGEVGLWEQVDGFNYEVYYFSSLSFSINVEV